MKRAEAVAGSKKRSGKPMNASQPPNKKGPKKNGDAVSACLHSVSFGVEELLLVA